MVEKKPIKCPKCNATVIEDERNIMHMVLTEDIKCLSCGTVVIHVPIVTC